MADDANQTPPAQESPAVAPAPTVSTPGAPAHAAAPPESPRRPQPWALAGMGVLIVALLVGGSVFLFKSCVEAPARVIGSVGSTLATVAAAFHQGTITTSFVSYATTVTNTLYLQVATLRQMEIFTRTQQMSTAFGYMPLPDVVVEARAPVEYTYFLDLNGDWRFVIEDHRVIVYAPPLQFNQPAVDASAITYEVRKGLLKTAEATENLKQSIKSLVILRARENVPLVRGNARQQVADFAERWLARSFSDGKQYSVKVYFADEQPPPGLRLKGPEFK
jgi:hypothetical protein